MISFLRGKILRRALNFIIIDVRDVGYKVFVNSASLSEAAEGQQAEFYIHQHVKEDALDLYGFRSLEELEMFELLLSISGVGPKSALGVLVVGKVGDIKESIARGDSSLLTKVSGIGKKTAERIVLELREKVGKMAIGSQIGTGGMGISIGGDEIDALMSLGYSLQQAREALQKVDPSITDTGKRIKEALRGL